MDKFYRVIAFLLLISFVSCTSTPYATTPQPTQQQPQQTQGEAQTTSSSLYWTGDGGKGISITILPPRGSGLAEDQAYLPDLVANELVSNFNGFSAMTLFDRVNNQRQYDELLSGYYADDDAAGLDLGHLASTDYMLLGAITKTSTGYTLQLTVNRNSDKTTVATYSGTTSIAELDNLLGVRRASLDLLQKMGVQVTAQARTELTRAATVDQVNALTSMAQGINAQRQGTEVAALTYFFQAAAFDASLVEAVSRTNVLSVNISTGNIGADVRNDFTWYDDWKAKLTETETFINDMLRNTNPQRSVWYSDSVREEVSARDPAKRTTELRIDAVLHTHAVFPVSVQKTVQAVYDGLQTTGRAQAWRLDGWPRQGVTNTNPFNRTWGSMIPIAFEVLNGQGQVIGRQTVQMDSRFSFNGTRLDGPATAFTTVRFTGVRADEIQYPLSIRIASINGRLPEEAGFSQIAPISAQQIQDGRNFTIYNGVIRPSSNNRNLGAVTIPAELWGERVTGIASGAYENSGLTGLTIPNSVTSIGENAFANNKLGRYRLSNNLTSIGNKAFYNALSKDGGWAITIPNTVISIGNSAFENNTITSVTIPEGVTTIGDRAFADNHWTVDVTHYGLTSITIPSSVTSIGQEAFASHWTTSERSSSGSYYTVEHWLVTEVTIGANVKLGNNAIGNGFEAFYTSTGSQAGAYKYGGTLSITGKWERFDNKETLEQKVASDQKMLKGVSYTLGALAFAGVITWIILDPKGWKKTLTGR